ncbi:hypothetical protein AABC73_18550 [Pseudomonas sp. G.S.17]|uniref:hypothetical protein n=1 Tax=Pseudomonas sp. G.S.17 TaxID=3137451 RepID=UPI00311CA348
MNTEKSSSSATNSNTATSVASSGAILIRDKDNATCSLPAPASGSGETKIYGFRESDSPCKNDTARTVQFTDLPSATKILLADRDDAIESEDQNFWFSFVTTRKRTSTIIIELEYIDTYAVGDIIEPGLQLTGKYRKNGNAQIRDTLSGVSIRAATSPPDPA